MRSQFLYIRDMFVNARGNIDRFRATAVKEGHVKRGEYSFMSVACGRIHQGHERISDDPQGRQ